MIHGPLDQLLTCWQNCHAVGCPVLEYVGSVARRWPEAGSTRFCWLGGSVVFRPSDSQLHSSQGLAGLRDGIYAGFAYSLHITLLGASHDPQWPRRPDWGVASMEYESSRKVVRDDSLAAALLALQRRIEDIRGLCSSVIINRCKQTAQRESSI